MQVPIELLILDEGNKEIVNQAISVLNNSQDTFRYSILSCPKIDDPIYQQKELSTTEIYSFLDKVRLEIKGYHPHIICVIDRYLSGKKLFNIFASLERIKGNITGRGIVTSYQVTHLIEDIPLQVYFQFYFLIKSLRFLVREKMGHKERRYCIYDQKINKRDLYKIMQYGTFCLECNDKIRSLITSEQMGSVRKVIGTISDISHSKTPRKAFYNLHEKIGSSNSIRIENEKKEQKNLFEETIELIKKAETEKAFDEISLVIKEHFPERYNEAIMLYSRLNHINLEHRIGIIEDEKRNLEKNRLNHSLLELINKLKENENDSEQSAKRS